MVLTLRVLIVLTESVDGADNERVLIGLTLRVLIVLTMREC